MKEKILQSTIKMGMPADMDINIIFNNMSNLIKTMKTQLDEEGE
jgi:hypothetical protein